MPGLERLVAEVDGQVVGTVCFGVFGDRLRVIGLAVLPELRRRGVARALVEELRGWPDSKAAGRLRFTR